MIIKNLPLKGAAKLIKAGSRMKHIKLPEGDHNSDCNLESSFDIIYYI